MNAIYFRRKRQLLLLLAAILIPTGVLISLTVRLARQDAELAEKRVADERREAVEQLRRELAARLETIKLQQQNRPADEGRRNDPDNPVIFAAPLVQDRLILPWETALPPGASSSAGAQFEADGEAKEFLSEDFAAAVAAYHQAVMLARRPLDRCQAMLSEARARVKQDRRAEATAIYRTMLRECDSTVDRDGMALASYAAERLTSLGLDPAAALVYLLEKVRSGRWLPPVQAYLLRSLLPSGSTVEMTRAREALSAEIDDSTRIVAFANDMNRLGRLDFPFDASPGRTTWLAYGDDPWLMTIMPRASFTPRIVLAVSLKKIAPPGVTFAVAPGENAAPLGEGFIDLAVQWPPGRFMPATAVPPAIYAAGILLILSITLIAGYLLFRDVSREIEIAEMRSDFVASVSHELKTPLTAIRMFAETLAMGRALDERTRGEYLQTVVNESERLSRLVDNVLDFSRIDRGKKIYRMAPVSPAEVVRAAERAMQYSVARHGFRLNVVVEEAVPPIIADADALEQAVLNLLANALKYSGDAREIDLRLSRSASHAVISVADRGIGISATDQKRIFEKFYRVRSGAADQVPGTGLGLTLASHIVEAHGGRLEVSSEPGCGSTFSIHMPLKAS